MGRIKFFANKHKMVEAPKRERTFIMIKPDGVQRGLVGTIIARFEQKGFKLVGMKLCAPGKAHFEQDYADLAGKGFFAGLIDYASSGPVCAMVWEGDGAVLTGRKISVLPSPPSPPQAPSVVTSAS